MTTRRKRLSLSPVVFRPAAPGSPPSRCRAARRRPPHRVRGGRRMERRLRLLAASGVELQFLETTFGRPAAELEALLDDAAAAPGDAPGCSPDALPPDGADRGGNRGRDAPAPPTERALAALGNRVRIAAPGAVPGAAAATPYRLDGAPASVPDLIRAARAQGVRISYPGIDPPPRAFAAGPSARPARRRILSRTYG